MAMEELKTIRLHRTRTLSKNCSEIVYSRDFELAGSGSQRPVVHGLHGPCDFDGFKLKMKIHQNERLQVFKPAWRRRWL